MHWSECWARECLHTSAESHHASDETAKVLHGQKIIPGPMSISREILRDILFFQDPKNSWY